MKLQDWKGPELPEDWELRAKKGLETDFNARVARLPEPKASDAKEAWKQLKGKIKSGDLSDLVWPPMGVQGKFQFHADTQQLVGVVMEADPSARVLLLLRITLKE